MGTKLDSILDCFENKIPLYFNSSDVRTSQVQMALHVAEFLQKLGWHRLLFIEAPVGTGKSLGVLVPALVERGIIGGQVLYATSTLNLQGQLMSVEVPLCESLSLAKSPILAKGKSHYYCHREFERKRSRLKHRELQENFAAFFTEAETGQRNEFEERYGSVRNEQWSPVQLTVSKRECEVCKYARICPSWIHRSRFLSTTNDLVITNHDQLIQSVLNTKAEYYQGPVVPISPGIVVIDEAHDFQMNFLGRVTQTVTLSELFALASSRGIPSPINQQLVELLNSCSELIEVGLAQLESDDARCPLTKPMHEVLTRIYGALNTSLAILLAPNSRKEQVHLEERIESVMVRLAPFVLSGVIPGVKKVKNDEFVCWAEYGERKFCAVSRSFTTQFQQVLDALLMYNKVVIMSGTLTVDGDFGPLLEQWRITRRISVESHLLKTPFDYSTQAIMYVPKQLVSPKHPDYAHYVANQIGHVRSLLDVTDGRTLILCTSKKHMDSIYDGIMPILEEKGIKLFHQKMGSVEYLTDQFKRDERSVLIGTGSFFSGFSVQGSSLISVIITKLPFAVRDDPYLELLGEGLEDRETQVLISDMMVKLKQAVGRLIRDISDYGLVTILDPRIYGENRYGRIVQETFQEMGYRFVRDQESVVAFVNERRGAPMNIRYSPYMREKLSLPASLTVSEVPAESLDPIETVETGQRGLNVKPAVVTQEQKQFYKSICKMRGVPAKRKFTDPFKLYQYLFGLFYTKNESTDMVVNKFPFETEGQRVEFQKYNGTELVRTYHLSREEMEKYFTHFKK